MTEKDWKGLFLERLLNNCFQAALLLIDTMACAALSLWYLRFVLLTDDVSYRWLIIQHSQYLLPLYWIIYLISSRIVVSICIRLMNWELPVAALSWRYELLYIPYLIIYVLLSVFHPSYDYYPRQLSEWIIYRIGIMANNLGGLMAGSAVAYILRSTDHFSLRMMISLFLMSSGSMVLIYYVGGKFSWGLNMIQDWPESLDSYALFGALNMICGTSLAVLAWRQVGKNRKNNSSIG